MFGRKKHTATADDTGIAHRDPAGTKKARGTASRVFNVLFRLGELCCGAIVLGILGRLFYLVDLGGSHPNARLIYAAVIASLTILHSILFLPPFPYTFWTFPIDIFFFVAWLVVFCLLVTLAGTNACDADWYRSYWGYYWGRWYLVGPPGINIHWSGCSAWRAALAFSFIAFIVYLLSALLGIYWVVEHGKIAARGKNIISRSRPNTSATTGGVTGAHTAHHTGPTGSGTNVSPTGAPRLATPAPPVTPAPPATAGSLTSHPPGTAAGRPATSATTRDAGEVV